MTMFHNYDADNFYNKDILKNFWETCFVSAVSWDKGMRADPELTMTRTHSNEGSMMRALGNNWISQTSCYWNIFDLYSDIMNEIPVTSSKDVLSPVSHGAPGQHKHCHSSPGLCLSLCAPMMLPLSHRVTVRFATRVSKVDRNLYTASTIDRIAYCIIG